MNLVDVIASLIPTGGASSSSASMPLQQSASASAVSPEEEELLFPNSGDPELEANYKKAQTNGGPPKIAFRTVHEWKAEFGNNAGQYKQQMWWRRLSTKSNKSSTGEIGVDVMIKRLLQFDEQREEAIRNYQTISSNATRGRYKRVDGQWVENI